MRSPSLLIVVKAEDDGEDKTYACFKNTDLYFRKDNSTGKNGEYSEVVFEQDLS